MSDWNGLGFLLLGARLITVCGEALVAPGATLAPPIASMNPKETGPSGRPPTPGPTQHTRVNELREKFMNELKHIPLPKWAVVALVFVLLLLLLSCCFCCCRKTLFKKKKEKKGKEKGGKNDLDLDLTDMKDERTPRD
ncbi:synaptotagmin-1-like [Alosa alosa]|uniref:synaptotagmin-1-like n=1 Tax=Alosa alosa TaxID=278164 RepID=UPI0020154753|nr:synaptotagmin-1-like [Alosa alosa]